MELLIYILSFYFVPFVGMYNFFDRAGHPKWAAFVPFYNAYIVCRIIGAPNWWYALMFIPLIHFFIIAGMLFEMNKSFGKHKFMDNLNAVIFTVFYFAYQGTKPLNYETKSWEVGRNYKKELKKALKEKDKTALRKLEKNRPFPKKVIWREWSESIIFAVFAAHFIRMFLIEAYTIPTPSMEGSLLVGDFLFVSKLHYGSRMPMTPLAFPLIHNMLPFTGGESYSKSIKWDYKRLPKLQRVERYDPVVFNYPEDDTVYGGIEGAMDYPNQYHNKLKRVALMNREKYRTQLLKNDFNKMVVRPVDKRTHYIKRCVGIPGDTIEVKAGLLHVNGKVEDVDGIQYLYQLYTSVNLDYNYLMDKYAFELDQYALMSGKPNIICTSEKVIQQMTQDISGIDSFSRYLEPLGTMKQAGGILFPYDFFLYPWNIDWYGPLVIPAKDVPISLNIDNICIYQRLITAYEGNELMVKNGDIFINGVKTDSYTPKLDYYWMMGDNRNNSADSRSWGFVPEDHIVGKPLFIWMSLKNGKLFGPDGGIRWERLFMNALGK